jgi:serine/threonine-protein kinase
MQQSPGLPIQRLRDSLAHAYTIDRELGRGGMASVFLAQDRKHDRWVAIKVLHPELAASMGPDRFLQEITLAARLNHPHILPLFDSGNADGLLYYVMPYVEGESLRERLDREQQLPVDETIRHGRAIASALDYANRQGIIHRDIKPENVMLYEGEAMVMDFGIAKALSAAGSEALVTQAGMMVGTPAYVSPEQASGEHNLDGRSDQYSLACMLYEMLSGERPFAAPTTQAMLTKRLTETPKPLRATRAAVPESIERAIAKGMSTNASARFPTTGQFGQALASGSLSTPSDTAALPQAVVSAAKSVAVLPFANMSADVENEYFTDGMAEEIINALSKIQALRVASRTSSFAFKGKNEDIGEIGRKLKVSTVLEGSVRKMGNRLRITAQLVNVADGYHLWSDGGCVRDPGRYLAGHRQGPAGDPERRRETADREGARGERRGLRLLPARHAVLSPASEEEPRLRPADVQQGDRDRPGLRPCPRGRRVLPLAAVHLLRRARAQPAPGRHFQR